MDPILQTLAESAFLKILTGRLLIDQIEQAIKMIINSFQSGGKLIIFGNGGSAADAQHLAAEFIGRFKLTRNPLPVIALTTDTSILTAVGNDFGFGHIFSRQVKALARKKDIILAISTSGNSNNVINAVTVARTIGSEVVGLTGLDGGGLKDHVDLLIDVPSEDPARIQEVHITIGHIICDQIEQRLGNDSGIS